MKKVLNNPVGRTLLRGLLKLNATRYKLKNASSHNKNEVTNMADLKAIFSQMEQRFDSSAAAGTDAIFQYEISDGGEWFVVVEGGNCSVSEGSNDQPTVTLRMDSTTLEEVMSGETDGMQAFMTGRIQADGDIMLATKLAALFPVA
ncbi:MULTISPECIES: SCP2 sterol-binding domain-containing protein [unclassified Neptuniibacter]|uniref:SCP2 sterol-binding domain-containing protein n=1 Tax=unclassified Neptuniibacter TaxID=2630693 RepID=UPI0026E35628|nr:MULTISPECIES: SCP2 sterol-binding domain-containing protein [unclassified Neptuniibacter]MDO6515435.1 SCP2 sterol-binding domain-containing protein [Neptuniibacter sp. 2_MG-2023]MDO6595102.1 SCP2 sterol-binding domain-containing protein [Neptuniibacter sp. 1_MG-2023]